MERLKSSSVSVCNGSTEEFYLQIYCKNSFSHRTFYVTIPDADIESRKSLRTLFDMYLEHMLKNFNQILWYEIFKILSFLEKKMVNHFWERVDAILEDVAVT